MPAHKSKGSSAAVETVYNSGFTKGLLMLLFRGHGGVGGWICTGAKRQKGERDRAEVEEEKEYRWHSSRDGIFLEGRKRGSRTREPGIPRAAVRIEQVQNRVLHLPP